MSNAPNSTAEQRNLAKTPVVTFGELKVLEEEAPSSEGPQQKWINDHPIDSKYNAFFLLNAQSKTGDYQHGHTATLVRDPLSGKLIYRSQQSSLQPAVTLPYNTLEEARKSTMWYESALAFNMSNAGLAAATKTGNDIQNASAWSLVGYGTAWTCVSDSVKIINAGGENMAFPVTMDRQTYQMTVYGGNFGQAYYSLGNDYSTMPVDVFNKNSNKGNTPVIWGDH